MATAAAPHGEREALEQSITHDYSTGSSGIVPLTERVGQTGVGSRESPPRERSHYDRARVGPLAGGR
jgi:hypothetical protein